MPKIGIVAAATGNGHISVAKAIQSEFAERGMDVPVFEHFYEDLMFSNQFMSNYYNFLMTTSTPLCSKFSELSYLTRPDISQEFYRGVRTKLKRFLKKNEFDVLISTSHTINPSIVRAIREMGLEQLQFDVVVTDPYYPISLGFDVVGTHKIYCCSDVVKKFLLKKIDEKKVVQVNYPVNQKFLHKFTKEELDRIRTEMSIEKTSKVVLINSGSQGAFHYIDIIKEVVKCYPTVLVLFVCGKNEALFLMANSLFKSNHNIRVLGFVSNMEELLAISDFVLGKAGANTFFECITMKKPMVVDGIDGFLYQEKGVTNYLETHKIGKVLDNIADIKKVLEEFIVEDSNRRFINELEQIPNDNGAGRIVDDILDDYKEVHKE